MNSGELKAWFMGRKVEDLWNILIGKLQNISKTSLSNAFN